MFDDPQKALARLQDELMAAEHRNEDWDEEEDPEEALEEMKSFLEEEAWEETEREPLSSRYAREDDEVFDFFDRDEEESEEPPKKKKKVDPLIIALVEMVGVAVLIGGYLLWNR